MLFRSSATGNNFDIQIELQLLDDNPERKTVITNKNTKGETLYYSIYTENITAKILDEIKNNENGEYNLKKDDYIVVTVKNTNVTIGTQFKNMFYQIVGKDAYTIGASSAALVTSSGKEDPKQADGKTVIREFKERKVKMQIHKEETITVGRAGINMVVILDSESSCTPYHAGKTDTRMFTAIESIYSSLNNMGPQFYLGFIETANPRTLKAECSKGNPPNSHQISTTAFSGNYKEALSRAVQKLKQESMGNNRLNIICFMSWTGGSDTERNAANGVIKTNLDTIDILYTMGCCGAGSLGNKIDLWKTTLGTKYGGHLPNGIVKGDIVNMLTQTKTVTTDSTAEVTSNNGRVLLDGLDMSKPIKIKINGVEYTYGENPFRGNEIVQSGGKYYLDLRNVAASIGKPNLNDVTIEISFNAR